MKVALDTGDNDSVIERLAAIAEGRRALAAAEAAEVRRARMEGYSWAEIGTVLGVSKQAMHRKYGRGN